MEEIYREEFKRENVKTSVKVRITLPLTQETMTTWEWIAQRLGVGAGAYAVNNVCEMCNGKQHTEDQLLTFKKGP
jgi:predicted double-glycine peptidase